jgi:8-oxo-dGTP pyrophosphatase MutT (NUDIX family)
MAIKAWQVISEEDVSPSKWYPLFKQTIKLPNGKIIDDYYLSRLGEVATVLLITKEKEIVFCKQYKHGAGRVLLELPAGRRDKEDLTSEAAAIRELQEETGYIAHKVEFLGKLTPSPTKDTTYVYAYLCQDYSVTTKTDFDFNEEIETVLVPIKDLKTKITNGDIVGSDVLAIVFLASLKYPQLFNYANI